ncbi:MAG: tRNA lysidine(34) synthetase TilS [Pseudomonadota bacterium]
MNMKASENHIAHFLRTVEKTISDNRMFGMQDAVLVGLSGGPDSVALLWSLHLLAQKGGFRIAAAHLNHGLRGKDADADAAFAAGLAARLNIPITVQTADVRGLQKTHKLCREEAARNVRYDFLHHVSQSKGYSKIALGHHADDNAELVLMNFLRGSGLAGLSGIPALRPLKPIRHPQSPPDSPMIVRPLIRLTQKEIYAFLEANDLTWQTDHSNSDTRYLRNRIRQELIPTLKKDYNLNIVETLNRLAEVAGNENRWITDILAPILDSLILKEDGQGIVLSVPRLRKQPRPAARRILRMVLMRVKEELRRITFQHVESILDLCHNDRCGGRLDLPDRVRVELNSDQLIISRGKTALRNVPSRIHRQPAPDIRYQLDQPGAYFLGDLGMTVTAEILPQGTFPDFRNSGQPVGFFDMDTLCFPLTARCPQPGDKFNPLGTGGTQKLKKFFIDHKIPLSRRAKCPVLLSAGRIIWVMGLRIDERFKVTPSTKKILKIELRLAEPVEGN